MRRRVGDLHLAISIGRSPVGKRQWMFTLDIVQLVALGGTHLSAVVAEHRNYGDKMYRTGC